MPSISKIAATYMALTAATFLTGARAAAIQGVEVEKCGFNGPIPSPSPASNTTKRQETAGNSGKPTPSDDGRVLNVGVYMHVVGIPEESNASVEFLLTRGDLNRQIDALNKYYTQANVSFQLLDADWTKDDFLADESAPTASRAMDSELALGLHKGNISTLNMFLIDSPSIAFAGSSKSFIDDDDEEVFGIIVGVNTVPGSSHPVWNLGVTAAHEAGHWFGLGHTAFTNAGDCEPNWLKQDGLSNEPCGARCDANIMSYGADACLTEFTAKQIAAIRDNAIKILGL